VVVSLVYLLSHERILTSSKTFVFLFKMSFFCSMLMSMLDTKLKEVLSTTKKHLSMLSSLGIETVRDLLLYYPRAYTDERESTQIIDMKLADTNVVQGRLTSFKMRKGRNGMYIGEGIISDDTGSIPVIWFNQKYLEGVLRIGSRYYFSGKLKYDRGRSVFHGPKVEPISEDVLHTGRIVPVYHETMGLTSKWLRSKIYSVLHYSKEFSDDLPAAIRTELGLVELPYAISHIHFPPDESSLEKARRRLSFDELFYLQLKYMRMRKAWRDGSNSLVIERADDDMKSFVEKLGFSLTQAQRRTLIEILSDMGRGVPMLRLVQGDVGSGKTVIAALAALNVVKNGYQVAFMVPTEVLAKQHFQKLQPQFERLGITAEILVSGVGDKQAIYDRLKSGEIGVVIGTHALIQEKVEFQNLGLAIVDEQHRFGVEQRKKLASHGTPHLLSMTATPIPRTLAMIVYGDLDISIIDELPPGRKEIITRIVEDKKRVDAYRWIREQIESGDQAYVICPLVDDSDALAEVKSVKAEFERLNEGAFKGLAVGLLHGKMSSQEKDSIMKSFKDGDIKVLVSTSVIEVGVDVANATIMMIEGAERFGLAQLHQFRGRVGRGGKQSYCFLLPSKFTPEGVTRLMALTRHHSGFDLADIDLSMRGPGEIYGTRQSGIPDLKIASFADSELIKLSRDMAMRVVEGQ